jgi:hypothetical protein
MRDPADDLIFNQWAGTMWLREQAHDWERLARDVSLSDEDRVLAALYARALREELAP